MNILVTGGEGFIGQHLVKALDKRGDTSAVMDLVRPWHDGGSFADVNHLCSYFECVGRADGEFDMVYHLAATSSVTAPDDEQLSNTFESTLSALRIADMVGASRFIFTSSGAIYGDNTLPISVYGACKQGAEGLVNAWAHRTGKRASILRLNNVVGPACRGVVPDTLAKLRANPRALTVLGNGTARKRFTYVDDVVRVLLDPPEGLHDIAPSDETSVADVVRWCIEATKTDPVITWGKTAAGWPGDMPVPFGGSYPGLMSSEQAVKRAIQDLL